MAVTLGSLMKKILIGTLLPVVVVFNVGPSTFAQAPAVLWSHIYRANSGASSLHELPDGGFVLGGYDSPTGESYRDMFIIRTNSLGDTLWTREIGESDRGESATRLCPTADGGFILTGSRGQDPPYDAYVDVYIVKTDASGQPEWGSTYGTTEGSENGGLIAPAFDGSYVAVGQIWTSSTAWDMWLFNVSSAGTMAWQNHLTWQDSDNPGGIAVTSGGGFAITGYSQSFDAEYDYDMFILRLDKFGNEMWARSYGSGQPYDEVANHICQTSDGGFLMCGHRQQSGADKQIYVVKTDASGNQEWTSELGGTYHDVGWCCIETVDGGYAVSASWYIDGNWKVGLIKYNADGDTVWTAKWGNPANGHTPYGLVQTADNGFAVGGLMSGGEMSAFLMKFAAEPSIDPYTFFDAGPDVPVDDAAPSMDTITIDEQDLVGRSVIGVKAILDTLDHPAVDELTVTLSHDGLTSTLVAEGDATGTNFTGTVFADFSPIMLGGGLAPYTGTYRPNENLSAFRGTNPNGHWILSVSDGVSGNDGSLKAWSITLLTDIVLDVEYPENSEPIAGYELSQCYPNPFNPATTIRYSLPRRSDVVIEIFNVLGQKVLTLVDETKPVGEYEVTWTGCDSRGYAVTTGVYLYRIQAGAFSETRKMVLLK